MAAVHEPRRRSLAFVAGRRDQFAAMTDVLERALPGRQWDFVCRYTPAAVPPGSRVLLARRSVGFAARLWARAWLRPYESVCIAGQDVERACTGFLSTVAAALPADQRTAIDPRGRTAAIAPFGWRHALAIAATAVLLPLAMLVTRVGLAVTPSPAPARPRGGRGVAVLVPVLPDLSHTFVYREVLELKRLHPDYAVLALERGETSVVHREAAELLALSEMVPRASRNQHLLQYLGLWFQSPRAIAWVIQTFAPHTSSFGRGRPDDAYWLLRLEHLDEPGSPLRGLDLGRELDRRNVGFVHVYGSTFPAVRALIAHGLTGVDFGISTFADFDYPTPFQMLREKLSAASFVVTCSRYCAERLRQRVPSIDGRVAVVHNGLPGRYAEAKIGRPRDGRSRIVYVGRFVPKKGIDTLLEACRRLHASGVSFSCHLYGSGPQRGDLERLVADCGLRGLVVFEGELANEDFYTGMNEDDIFVCASRYMGDGERDGIPVSLMEAMAGGITVVSTTVSGIPELIRNGDNGYLVPPNDPAALADTLKALITTPSLRESVAARAIDTVHTEFTVEAAVRQIDALISGARG